MKAKGHLETFNHFSIVALDAALFRDSWEKAFGVRVPEIFEAPKDQGEDNSAPFSFTYAPTYKGGAWPAGKSFGVEQVSVPPLYQPDQRMIEVKAAGTLPSVTDFYEKYGNGIQYLGIVEGENRDPFLDDLREQYGCEKLEEMFYDPMPGDFCIVDTEPQLGFNLCVKKDGALNGAVHVILPDTAECTVVVRDLEESIRVWSDIFAINTPEPIRVRESGVFRGSVIEAEFLAARIDEAPFDLYLVQDNGDGPFSEFAEEKGFGIHHIAFDRDRLPDSFAERMRKLLKIDILAEYDLEGKHYTVYDSIGKMGAYIAVRS